MYGGERFNVVWSNRGGKGKNKVAQVQRYLNAKDSEAAEKSLGMCIADPKKTKKKRGTTSKKELLKMVRKVKKNQERGPHDRSQRNAVATRKEKNEAPSRAVDGRGEGGELPNIITKEGGGKEGSIAKGMQKSYHPPHNLHRHDVLDEGGEREKESLTYCIERNKGGKIIKTKEGGQGRAINSK